MASHPIQETVLNQVVGVPASEDGVMMIFCKGVAIGETLALETPYLLSKYADVTALGITAALDATNGTALWYQLNKFYNNGQNDGVLCWLVVTAIADNPYATYITTDTFFNHVRYTAQADPTERAKILGFCYEMPAATQSGADFPADVTATVLALPASLTTLFGQGFQLSAVVDGYMMSDAVTPESIGTRANDNAYPVSLYISGSLPNGVSDVGLILGQKAARITVGHSWWQVAGTAPDGALNTTSAYLTNGATILPAGVLVVGKVYTVLGQVATDTVVYNTVTYNVGQSFTAVSMHTTYTTAGTGYLVTGATPVGALTPGNSTGTGDIDYLGDKQYMFMRTWSYQSGFFLNDAATCTNADLQISSQEFNRVANKLSAAGRAFSILEMGKNQPLDPATGSIAQAALNSMASEFFDQYINPMINSNDISDGAIVFTGPNFNSLKALNWTLSINGEPIVSSVNGTIQFVSTLTNA
jgi:hypothetical protein